METGIVCAIVAFILAELFHVPLARTLQKWGLPYEWQHMFLFAVQFIVILAIQHLFFFTAAIGLLMKFAAIYSATGCIILLLLRLIRRVHYQSYIVLLNWIKTGE